jgi:hypothetical protein
MRPALTLFILSLACTADTESSSDSGSETACDGSTGRVWGEIIDYDGDPYSASTVVHIYPEGEDGYDLPAVELSYEVQLTPGHYTIGASSVVLCYATPEPELDVEICEEYQADMIMDLCVGR